MAVVILLKDTDISAVIFDAVIMYIVLVFVMILLVLIYKFIN